MPSCSKHIHAYSVQRWWSAHLPFPGLQPWSVPSQPQTIIALWPVPIYAARRQCSVNDLPRVDARERDGLELNLQSQVQRPNHYATEPLLITVVLIRWLKYQRMIHCGSCGRLRRAGATPRHGSAVDRLGEGGGAEGLRMHAAGIRLVNFRTRLTTADYNATALYQVRLFTQLTRGSDNKVHQRR